MIDEKQPLNLGSAVDRIKIGMLIDTLQRNGFVSQHELTPDRSTLELGCLLGQVLEIERILPGFGIPTVQQLRPQSIEESKPSRYSGNYGLSAFPLHTDLAHWFIPPRYILLRCVAGSTQVKTKLLHSSAIIDVAGRATVKKALLLNRRYRGGNKPLRVFGEYEGEQIFRWDSVFVRPANDNALRLDKIIRLGQWQDVMHEVTLTNPGDTILIDNWAVLHGRGPVPHSDRRRLIERVYLSDVSRC